MENDLEKQAYEESVKKYGNSSQALLYNNPQGQLSRFKGVFNLLKRANARNLCDVGCGHGDFYEYLRSLDTEIGYIGYDIIPEFVEEARKRHGFRFVGSLERCTAWVKGQFDATILIGLFTHTEENKVEKIKRLLDDCWEHTGKVMCVTFLTDNAFQKEYSKYYLSIDAIVEILSRYSEKWVIDRAELPYCAICGVFR
jgi:2-polyprenyl-3-methyl-5-hydroxy-6-metoxy-1,4-benzoquinol methylase